MKQRSILIIDDDQDVVTSIKLALKRHFQTVETETAIANVHHRIGQQHFDLVLLDMNFRRGLNDGNEGLYWLSQIGQRSPETSIVMMTAYGDVELAVEAMKRGASDFIQKPWTNARLLSVVERALKAPKRQVKPPKDDTIRILGRSSALENLLQTAEKVSETTANVLVLGENGTGKDLVAKFIHEHSNRSEKPFVKVDLGSLNENLFESELFGHVRGAFTDARTDKPGRFEAAQGGTLFLDEIGNLSLPLQAKLLTALQNRTITRLGSHQEIAVDVRLICATNMPVYQMVEAGEFRQDLLYRINTVELKVPALRQREEDIGLLAGHFLQEFADQYGRPVTGILPEAMKLLSRHTWPGNVRELRHAMERAVILCEGPSITPEDLNLRLGPGEPTTGAFETLNLMEMEEALVRKAILQCSGNISKAAKELGITRTALYRRMEKYGL